MGLLGAKVSLAYQLLVTRWTDRASTETRIGRAPSGASGRVDLTVAHRDENRACAVHVARAPVTVGTLGPFVALLIASGSVSAQSRDSVWVAGTVADSVGRPVPAAQVFVAPNSRMVLTDSVGHFLVRAQVGPALLIVRRIGYEAFAGEVALESGRDRRFRILLRPVALELDAFETRAAGEQYRPLGEPASLEDFYFRRARGRGVTFTRQELVKLGGFRGAVATVPGVRAQSGGTSRLSEIAMTRCPPHTIAWFLDGMRVTSMPELADTEIEALEVYRGPSQLPSEAVGNACGAIFVWTRRSP